jgi:AraC-like DNA-binding protein
MRNCRAYFAPGPEERAWGLTVTACGSTRIPPRSRYPLLDHPPEHDRPWATGRILPLWQVVLLTAGHGEFESAASGRVELEAPCVLVLFPHLRHPYPPQRGVGWVEWWLEARGPALDELRRRGALDPRSPALPLADPSRLRARWESLLDIRDESPFARERRAALAALIVAELMASVRESPAATPRSAAIARACALMGERLERPLDQRRLASEVGLAYGTYRRGFLRATGLPPHQYLLSRRMTLARELLLTTSLPVEAVARRCGFASPFYFTRLCRARFGAPPTRLRAGC